MQYVGLLSDEQKRAGYFTSRDEDFVYLFHRGNGTAIPIGIWPRDDVKVMDVVNTAQRHLEENHPAGQQEPFIRCLGGYRGGPLE